MLEKEKLIWVPLEAKAANETQVGIINKVPSHDLIHQLKRHINSGIALTGEQIITIASRKNLPNDDRLTIISMLYPRMVDRHTFPHERLLSIVNKEFTVRASVLIAKLRKDSSGHSGE